MQSFDLEILHIFRVIEYHKSMQFPLHTCSPYHFSGKSRVTPPFLLTNAHLYTDVCYRIPKALSGLLCSTKALTFCTSKDYDSSCVDRVGSRACVAGE